MFDMVTSPLVKGLLSPRVLARSQVRAPLWKIPADAKRPAIDDMVDALGVQTAVRRKWPN